MKLDSVGYDTLGDLVDSTFHPNSIIQNVGASAVLAGIGVYTEKFLGLSGMTVLTIILLFGVELLSGVKASFKEGRDFCSKKFWGGFLKLGIYFILMGISHVFHQELKPADILGFEFNVYEWLHYLFINFTIISLFTSCIENFDRLGWSEFVPGLKVLKSLLRIKGKPQKIKENEEN